MPAKFIVIKVRTRKGTRRVPLKVKSPKPVRLRLSLMNNPKHRPLPKRNKPSKKVRERARSKRPRVIYRKHTPNNATYSQFDYLNWYWDKIGDVITSTPTHESGANIGAYNTLYISSSVNTPNYLQLRDAGQLPLHPHSRHVSRSEGTPYFDYYEDLSQEHIVTYSDARKQNTFWPIDYGDSVTNEAKFRARQRLAASVNEAHANLGVIFAERKKTASLIASTIKRVALAAVALKKGRLGDMYHQLGMPGEPSPRNYSRVLSTPPAKRLSQHWLEYTFGWTPLLSDCEGAAKLLAKHVEGDYYHSTAKGSAKNISTRRFKYSTYGFEGFLTEKTRYRYLVRIRLDSYARAALAETGISNPLTVAWEVLPYSFVVDWFYPVSNYLKTLYAFDGFELVDGTESKRWQAAMTKNYFRAPLRSGNTYTSRYGQALYTQDFYDRTLLVTFPPSVLPTFRNPLEKSPLWTFATSLALLRVLFK